MTFEAEKFYQTDKNLKKEDAQALIQWCKLQPHLPDINEIQAILFLHSCYYSNEKAKTTIDNYFTLKTNYVEIFQAPLLSIPEICVQVVLPRKTPQNYSVCYVDYVSSNLEKFNFAAACKLFHMIMVHHLHEEGPSDGFLLVLDYKNITFGHVPKIGPLVLKKIVIYLQEALPVRLKGLHVLNCLSFLDALVTLAKSFMSKEVKEMLQIHDSLESLSKYVPLECLPKDYGGSLPVTISDLHESMKRKLEAEAPFFKWDDSQMMDESRRQKKGDEYGVQGTFKKLEID